MTKAKPINIVHIIHRFDTGGLENGVVNLINHLPESEYRHSIVTLIGYNEDFCKRIKNNNVSFYNLEKKSGNDFAMFFRLRKLLKKIKPDILHTRNTASLECQFVGWLSRVPFRIHGEHGWDMNDLHGTNKKYQWLRKIMSLFIHRYVALSSEAVDYLTDTIGITKKRIQHICNGVNLEKFSVKNTAYAKTGTADTTCAVPNVSHSIRANGKLRFATVGRLESVKNQQLLVEAYIQLLQQQPTLADLTELVIVGDGSQRLQLEAIAAKSHCQSNVIFLGNRSDVPALMQTFDVFILPSLAEGISNTILEAMACGLPIIATDVGGNADLVKHQYNGDIIPSNIPSALTASMLKYALSDDLVIEHGLASRQRAEEHFSIQVMTAAYNKLYRQSAC
ncbi:TIGR03088 family PEP-CTERM/XrtA system glycosyltransferase [Flocculibacter collagenilyticus]|uniref:TIGR03088 family PEP-CTERM/XrtA system glycosyltransferase n=1 Tax=Flocculibacter collagenilyticus TaxID=2744479 RepID=UPI0018F51D37|nr:TIGR03088 family PEP-CTERM/XrtA system glycosyltransferase [Flocculibacter collagenilyticus]